ncbi:amino acid adenylation domain-containing protein [Nostoc sp.]|uniref:amino acid adenylation domain-containing protein n=1 Tax=Nostoc sp. TaxID=1180 RepID=UPI002FFBB624
MNKTKNIEDIYPLSPTQQGVLFHTLYASNSGVYVTQIHCALSGSLNVPAFKQVWQQVVNRHPVLRTSFHWEQRKDPFQVVYRHTDLPWEQHDWRGIELTRQQIMLETFLQEDFQRGLDIAKPPLMRLSLIQLAENSYQFVWSKHHLILDGWSTALVFQEVFDAYEALHQGKNLPLLASRAYGKYIAWLQQRELSQAETFWKQTLKNFTAPTPLVATWSSECLSAQSQQQESYGHQQTQLSIEVTTALQAFAKQHRLTLNTLMQGAWAILLSYYSGEQDVIFGSVVSGRPPDLTGVESMVGLFINTLPMRVEVAAQASLISWLKQLQTQQIELRQYEYSPLVQVQNWSEIPRGMSLFESIIIFENYPVDYSLQTSDRSLRIGQICHSYQPAYPLEIEVIVKPNQGLSIAIDYDYRCFAQSTINKILGHLQNLLAEMIIHSDQSLAKFKIITASEQHHLLVEFNYKINEHPIEKTIHQLFTEQVNKTPKNIAVVCGDSYLTYQELNEKSNQLATFLREELAVKYGEFIAIYKERDTNFLIAILAILKAGGAYLPIDNNYPQERIRYMLSNSEVRILLTESSLVSSWLDVKEHCTYLQNIICLDVVDNIKLTQVNIYHQQDYSELTTQNLDFINQSTSPAYMIYTSGSTGLPKGAIVRHDGAINHIYAQYDELELTEDFCFLQNAPSSTDISVWQFLAPLLIGGKTVIVDIEDGAVPNKLFKVLKEKAITVVELVPTIFGGLLDYISQLSPDKRLLPELKWMMVVGEPVSVKRVNQWLKLYPEIKVADAYGPTEAADDITQFIIEQPLPENQQTVPIGKPLANLNIYILDRQMRLLPVGVPGEICVSGIGVGAGYWKNPEKTKNSFVPNPFTSNKKPLPENRQDLIYKTGDLGRWLADGNIEFLGRIDHQVKIRGFRVELGEIEALLSQHSAVRETVVVVREDKLNYKRLVAYVVPITKHQDLTDNPDIQSSELGSQLRDFLKPKLPDHMLPSAVVVLESLPLTPNGKVDRPALPAPDQTRPELEETFVAPRTAVEDTLAKVWAEVLGIERVGIHDNFFKLGGDSIVSIQIIAKAHQAGLNLTPKQIFQHQTIAELAMVADTNQSIQAEQGLVTGVVYLTPIQHDFFAQNLLDKHHWNQSILLEVRQTLDPNLLERALLQLLVHHDALRLRFEQTASGWQQMIVKPDEQVRFSYLDLSRVPPQEQESVLEATATKIQASLNLSLGSMVRMALFNSGKDKTSRLLIVIHHLAVDGVSWRILVEDLQTIYQQLERREAIALPAKTTSFQQWSKLLQEYANSVQVQQELDYWLILSQRQLKKLPVDQEGLNTEASVRTVVVSLGTAETKVLLQEVPAVYHTQINDVLLTALVQAFAQWTGERSLLINLEGHGREEIFADVNVSRTVGWFTTMFPVLLDLRTSDNPGEALKAIKEQLRCIPDRGIGYGMLRYLSTNAEKVELMRSLPQAEVVFNYLGQFDQAFSESSIFNLAFTSKGLERSQCNTRSELLVIDGLVVNGELQLHWKYSQAVHHQGTIEKLAQMFTRELRSLIAYCQSPAAGGYTPSDFPLAKLEQSTLDKLLGKQRLIEDVYPLSPIQQGILFHTLYTPELAMYFEQFCCILHGQLNISALRSAWQQVIDRHPVLRSAFYWEFLDHPLQVVHQQVEIPWYQEDWQSLSPDERQEYLKAFLDSDRQSNFILSQAPLMRITLIQMGEEEYQFIWSHHHLLIDGWSIPLILQEVFQIYQRLKQGQKLSLELRRTYSEYITWLQQQDITQAEKFWRHTLQGLTAPTTLLGGEISQKQSYLQDKKYQQQEIIISAAILTGIQTIARQNQLTLNTLLQGAWAILLSYYSSEQDVIFGATVSGRPPTLVGANAMIGVFINTLPMRVLVLPDSSILPWLKDIQEQQVTARQYEHSPLVKVHQWSDISSDLAMFESILVFQNYPIDDSLLEGRANLRASDVLTVSMNNYPLTLRVTPTLELSLEVLYNSYYFDSLIITRILKDLQAILSAVSKHPDIKIKHLIAILDEVQKQHKMLKNQDFQASRRQKLGKVGRQTITGVS